MSWFQLPSSANHLSARDHLFGCGMVALLFYAWARAEKLRRREVSARNREAPAGAGRGVPCGKQAKRQARKARPAKEG
jgi:hypothetical protein